MSAFATIMFFAMLVYGFVFAYTSDYAKGTYFLCLAILMDRMSDYYQAKIDEAISATPTRKP